MKELSQRKHALETQAHLDTMSNKRYHDELKAKDVGVNSQNCQIHLLLARNIRAGKGNPDHSGSIEQGAWRKRFSSTSQHARWNQLRLMPF